MSSTARRRGRRAWGGDPPHAAAASERILAAAARCIERDGLTATTLAAIAGEARVSRQTVYRHFTGRDQLVLRSMRRAAERLRERIDLHIRTLADPADMIVETMVRSLSDLRGDPVLRAITDPARSDGSVVALIAQREGIDWAREALAPAIEAAGWSRAEADARLELVLRVFLSLVVSPPAERSPDELRAFLYRYLVPGLGLAADEEP